MLDAALTTEESKMNDFVSSTLVWFLHWKREKSSQRDSHATNNYTVKIIEVIWKKVESERSICVNSILFIFHQNPIL